MNATKTTLVEVMEFHGHQIAFEEINGKMMVNATQMAKSFGKKPDDWIRTQQAKELVNSLSASLICEAKDLQVVRNGGKNYGTFLHEELALIFAQWLSPEFYLACNRKLKELLVQKNSPQQLSENYDYQDNVVFVANMGGVSTQAVCREGMLFSRVSHILDYLGYATNQLSKNQREKIGAENLVQLPVGFGKKQECLFINYIGFTNLVNKSSYRINIDLVNVIKRDIYKTIEKVPYDYHFNWEQIHELIEMISASPINKGKVITKLLSGKI